jgi:hypothetical protein
MHQRMTWNKRTAIVVIVAILFVGAGVGWLERMPLQKWFYLRGLAGADEASRALWVERVSRLDSAATPELADLFTRDDPRICANSEAALAALYTRWNLDDARYADLNRRLIEGFSRFSQFGQRSSLRLATSWLGAQREGSAIAPETRRAVKRLLEEAARAASSDGRAAALELADRFLGETPDSECVGPCRELVVSCFADSDSDNRVRAVQLAVRPGMELQKPLVALLNDPAPEVRRLVMPVAGSSKNVMETEDLLRWLHDSDAEVRQLCETALRRNRGLSHGEIRLGKLITDSSARVRLQVLNQLGSRHDSSLYTGAWLRHLSHDPAPEVRFAAIRAIKEQGASELSDRIDQMARNDPSPTVCDYAQRYLSSQQKSAPQR